MAAKPPPAGVSALVVDDIVTTGATLAECVRALRTAGWPVLGAAVIASTPTPVIRRVAAIGRAQATGLA